MSWQPDIDELHRRAAIAREMGGPDSVAFHHGRGKLTVRERIDLLADPGSFAETGVLAGRAEWDGTELAKLTPSNSVTGIVRIDGRKVAVHGGDFTIRGGSADGGVADKAGWAVKQAYTNRIPMIRLLDATGGSVRTFETMGRTYLPANDRVGETELLQMVPVVSAVLGSVAGLPAVHAAMCHFNVMVKGTSQLFVAGPARRQGGARYRYHQGRAWQRGHPGAPVRRRREPRRGRARRPAPGAPLPLVPPPERLGDAAAHRAHRRPRRAARTPSSPSSRATGAACTTRASCSRWSSTATRSSRSSPSSDARASRDWRGSTASPSA